MCKLRLHIKHPSLLPVVVVYFEQPSYSVFKNTTALSVCLVGDKGTAVPFVMTVTSVPNTAIEGLGEWVRGEWRSGWRKGSYLK